MRKHIKFFIVFIVFGFFLATIEFHADHDVADPQQTQHCCVQCCPSHNLATVISTLAIKIPQNSIHDLKVRNITIVLSEIPRNIFRPPMLLS